jgi:hypothetical protein
MKRIKFWPLKQGRTVLVEVDLGSLHMEYEFEDIDEARDAFKDLDDAITLVLEDWTGV